MSAEVRTSKFEIRSQQETQPAGKMGIIAGPNAQAIPNQLVEQPDFVVPAEMAREIDEVITHYPKKRSASLMLLHAVQEHFGYISRQAVEWIAEGKARNWKYQRG